MKDINVESKNQVCIIGKLLETSFMEFASKTDGRKFERANMTIRVTQTYDGQEETSDVPVTMFASPYTRNNKPNPAYETIQKLKTLNTVQTSGEAEAAIVALRNATIHENNWVSRSGQLVTGFQINNSFMTVNPKLSSIASFKVDAFIMDMMDEEDRNGDPTGRLIIKGGIVQYGGNLDVLNFIVEEPNKVDYLKRVLNPNDTIELGGRIRYTAKESTASQESSWGETLPTTTTVSVRELIVTTGDDEPKDEDFAYDPADIRKAFNARKARIEQQQIDAQKAAKSSAAAPTGGKVGTGKYDWE